MALDERSRHDLHRSAAEALGEAQADTLMELLPPVGWADVATKADVEHSTALLRGEMAQLKAELRGEMAQLGSGLRIEMERGFRRQTQFLVGAMVALQGVLIAALKLLP